MNHNLKADEDGDDNDEVIFKPPDEKEQKRRLRILRHFVKRRKLNASTEEEESSLPSFTDFLNISYDREELILEQEELLRGQKDSTHDDDDDDDKVQVVEAPRRMIVDVDAELGLKPKPFLRTNSTTNDNNHHQTLANCSSMPEITASSVPLSSSRGPKRKSTADRNHTPANAKQPATLTPQEEGYYEGIVSSMSLPEDSTYLSNIQCWTRDQLQLFSATARDSAQGTGRRSAASIVLGKVGVRCRHCATAAENAVDDKSPKGFLWPPAAVSYPFNMNGLYTACSQKPQLHFNHCPYLPEKEKTVLKLLTQEHTTYNDQSRSNVSNKRAKCGIPASLYYVISARRIGLMDVEDGMRFGRDLSLQPLPFETIYTKMQDERRDSLLPSGGDDSYADAAAAYGSKSLPSSHAPPSHLTRLLGDEASEQVLAQAVAEADNPQVLVARGADKSLVSDYIFLILKQMAFCHALPTDFSTRGKKTKLMRVGFAGFCCRHCTLSTTTAEQQQQGMAENYSCRSFCSAPDNLSSAITNSFLTHLSKCQHVPSQIKKALIAYRRIHPKQMAQLPYGSQRRMFHEIWARLRAADKSQTDMEQQLLPLTTVKPPPAQPSSPVLPQKNDGEDDDELEEKSGASGNAQEEEEEEYVPERPDSPDATTDLESRAAPRLAAASLAASPSPLPTISSSFSSARAQQERGPNFPVSNNPETIAMLQTFTNDWEPTSNDFLIMPEDKSLVSDYVFLTMRQLKIALPTSTDAVRMRRGTAVQPSFPGVCCVHCMASNYAVTPSGRSFPSAPDNFASALNSSFFNHMQACPFVPQELKRALADVRKLHSAQCAAVRFGSQRRFFNILFDRLKSAQAGVVGPSLMRIDDTTEISEAGFLQLPNAFAPTLFLCRRCNMIPIQFRVPGSIFVERPSRARAREHQKQCRGGRLNLRLAVESFRAAAKSVQKDPIDMIKLVSFQQLVQLATQSDQLSTALTRGIQNLLQNDGCDDDRMFTVESDLWKCFSRQPDEEQIKGSFAQLATKLQRKSTNLNEYPEFLAFLLVISPGLQLDNTNQVPGKSTA